MKLAATCVTLCLAALSFGTVLAAPATPEETQAALRYTAAWASLASYGDKAGQMARREFTNDGWQYTYYDRRDKKSDVQYVLLRKPQDQTAPAILAMTGTTNLADVRSDLRTHGVPFKGQAVTGPEAPRVHQGFWDYTQAILNTPLEDTTKEPVLASALIHADEKAPAGVLLTGHSLGGAAATLTAVWLAGQGVGPEQIRTITFGAPAVGNKYFVRDYDGQFHLDRIVLKGDPVLGLLQTFHMGYVQFPEETVWQETGYTPYFPHSMIVYADLAVRHYYDALWGQNGGSFYKPAQSKGTSPVYIAPVTVLIDPDLASSADYIKAAVADRLSHTHGGAVFSENTEENPSYADLAIAAKRVGKTELLTEVISVHKVKQEEETYAVSVSQVWRHIDGRLLRAEQYTTDTKELTPLLAVIYGHDEVDREENKKSDKELLRVN
ncbi:lipase family protein [uncultured Megasphaera sp.]|jgi:hypothetical protein|uniref:lipase family protein n=1 Tax=uncultured Megasphaera sp. TaxID=165188 RepID=UPI002582B044|nr:lipase family protein [uncultured Megasphaera sp.]